MSDDQGFTNLNSTLKKYSVYNNLYSDANKRKYKA